MIIEPWPAGRLKLPDPMLTEDMQRYLIAYLWKNKKQMVIEIVCDECPEHTGSV